jgi:hypothetical protein
VQQSIHPRPLFSVKQFSEKHPAFTQPSLRALIDKARERYSSHGVIVGNGLAPAIVRIGRKVLIDEEAFFRWLASVGETRAERVSK